MAKMERVCLDEVIGYFDELEDPRSSINQKHPLVSVVIIALIAGILGFGGIAGVSIEIAKAIFFIAVVLFIVSAVVGLARGRTRV